MNLKPHIVHIDKLKTVSDLYVYPKHTGKSAYGSIDFVF